MGRYGKHTRDRLKRRHEPVTPALYDDDPDRQETWMTVACAHGEACARRGGPDYPPDGTVNDYRELLTELRKEFGLIDPDHLMILDSFRAGIESVLIEYTHPEHIHEYERLSQSTRQRLLADVRALGAACARQAYERHVTIPHDGDIDALRQILGRYGVTQIPRVYFKNQHPIWAAFRDGIADVPEPRS